MNKRLYRSVDDRVMGGVCGGLGEYLNVDPTLVRLVCAFLILFGGTGLLLYLIAWIIIPEESSGKNRRIRTKSLDDRVEELAENFGKEMETRGPLIGGLALIALGGVFLINNLFPWFNLWTYWPVLLIIVGLLIILKKD